jgi:hypothetical protein
VTPAGVEIGPAEPGDHARVMAVLEDWWGGRRAMRDLLPRLFFVHFRGTSFVAERFFAVARADGRRRVSCVTSPANEGSIAFHTALGFEPGPPQSDYDGPGEDRVVFSRAL